MAKQAKPEDIEALSEALEVFTRTTQRMEEAYRALEHRLHELDRELAEKNRALALTTDYLGSLLESISDGVIAVDRDEVITTFNRAAASILGYDPEQILGKIFADVFGRGFTISSSSRAALLARSGRAVPVNEKDAPVSDPSGKRLGMVKTFQDLSELHALREQVRQRERLAALGEMAATVAHEIRNPLGGIRGFASLLVQDLAVDDPRRRLVDKILTGTQSLDRVVTELLEYTRPVELTLKPTTVEAIVEAALPFLEYDRERIRLAQRIPSSLKVLADAEKMRQVLLNLLMNASQSISGQGSISIDAQPTDEQTVEILIKDSGCGIPEDQLEQVFSPFFTTKQKGTGLGLAICQKITEAHGGRISVTSNLGSGSTFGIYLSRCE